VVRPRHRSRNPRYKKFRKGVDKPRRMRYNKNNPMRV
jgi:hypothetical protein